MWYSLGSACDRSSWFCSAVSFVEELLLFVEDGSATIESLKVHKLKSIWKK